VNFQGSFVVHELATDAEGNKTGKTFNSHVIINSSGEIASLYRKLHLFDVETPEMKFRESRYVEAGTGVVYPIQTPAGKVGMTICYDIRFPEVFI
jgi:deaminated glutathione amidase